MDSAFPDVNIANYEELITSLSLPDNNDRHVLAAAIYVNADVIMTFNLKDFPLSYLKSFGIEAIHPDEFVIDFIKYDKLKSLVAFINQVESLRNPPKSKIDVLDILAKCGLKNSIEEFRK
jgi:hypothetical protein